ncbi:NUDIX hydrolase [Miniphocaeibacter halophilus]|uniref:CoA pyrophosphatase n=1 Tax=Miniphocaeibacter halophilus TaxID=2931922 RepID=A0AC61MVT5_9FIRM|nr:CoA pyrophosphatase [Miniphocaeibacter halophilus]QQK08430.1 CoA pyrophosphatase [Miniphocaeibacter halophilus]
MNIERIFQNYEPKPIGMKKEYSVIILITKINEEDHIIFEKRSKHISQPGEVSLPGGKVELGETPLMAAKREASEELGVNIQKINIIGEMDYIYNLNNSIIWVFIGEIKNCNLGDFKSNSEVEYLFTYPVSYFFKNKPQIYSSNLENNFEEDFPFELIPNGKDYRFSELNNDIYFYENTKPLIWGLTAKIISKFIEICEGEMNE